MRGVDGDAAYNEITEKLDAGEKLSDEDIMKIVILPLTYGSEDSNTHGSIRQIYTYTASIILTVNALRPAMIFLSKRKSVCIELFHLTARDFRADFGASDDALLAVRQGR